MVTGFWIFVMILSTTHTVQFVGCQVTAKSFTPLDIYQPDKKLRVKIGGSTALQCCIFGIKDEGMVWFKLQKKGKQPQIIVRFFKTLGEKFYNEFQNSRFHLQKFSNCFNLTISNITMSDEATYYCALTSTDGTYLEIEGGHALCNNSVVCESKQHGNNTNINTQHKTEGETIQSLHRTVLGLGTALGLCAFLIICLTYFILRRKRDKIKTTTGDSSGMKQESEAEMVNYAALQFNKRKVNTEKRKTGLSEDCAYSRVE